MKGSGGRREGAGRKPLRPTDEMRAMVKAMASNGLSQEKIARVVIAGGMATTTLVKHFREELDTGPLVAQAVVADALFKSAKAGNVTAQIFWLKCRAGWKDNQFDAGDGREIRFTITIPKTGDAPG